MRSSYQLLLVPVAMLSFGCGSSIEPERSERHDSLIEFEGQGPLLTAPDTANRGVPFVVTIRTYGGGCTTEGGTDVQITGRLATLRPYDIELVTKTPCPAVLRSYLHHASIRFDSLGATTVTVEGRRQPGNQRVVQERAVWIK